MFQLDLKNRKSICEQITDNCKELIVSGVLSPEEKLPSVRELSRTLTVNPNTVQKAYSQLEQQGYIYVSPGLGTFVSPRDKMKIDESELATIAEDLRQGINRLYYLGIDLEDAKALLDKLIKERSGWK